MFADILLDELSTSNEPLKGFESKTPEHAPPKGSGAAPAVAFLGKAHHSMRNEKEKSLRKSHWVWRS